MHGFKQKLLVDLKLDIGYGVIHIIHTQSTYMNTIRSPFDKQLVRSVNFFFVHLCCGAKFVRQCFLFLLHFCTMQIRRPTCVRVQINSHPTQIDANIIIGLGAVCLYCDCNLINKQLTIILFVIIKLEMNFARK